MRACGGRNSVCARGLRNNVALAISKVRTSKAPNELSLMKARYIQDAVRASGLPFRPRNKESAASYQSPKVSSKA